ncbi:hypothetical protein ACTFIR_008242 [Dictyostelium discoideum]
MNQLKPKLSSISKFSFIRINNINRIKYFTTNTNIDKNNENNENKENKENNDMFNLTEKMVSKFIINNNIRKINDENNIKITKKYQLNFNNKNNNKNKSIKFQKDLNENNENNENNDNEENNENDENNENNENYYNELKGNNNNNNNNKKKKELKDNYEIYEDPNQRIAYKTLTVVKVKDDTHIDYALQQLRIQLKGKTGWNKDKNIIIGNIQWSRINDFIKNNTYYDDNEDFNIKVKENNNNDDNNNQSQPFIGFCKQIFPNSILIEEQSNGKWSDIGYDFISSNFKHCKWRTWRIQIVTPTSEAKVSNYRYQLTRSILTKARRFNGPLFACYNFETIKNATLPIEEDEALIQILCSDKKSSGYISVVTPPIYKYLEKIIGVYPSHIGRELNAELIPNYIYELFTNSDPRQYGKNHISHIKRNFLSTKVDMLNLEHIKSMKTEEVVENFLPSRSFLKLFELFQKFPPNLTPFPSMKPNETVIDLGSSPGGWTLFSLLQGCHVTSIDKSPLNSKCLDFNDSRNLKFLEMNAFEFNPDSSFDWLIIDMKVPPMKSLILLNQWLDLKLCHNFIVNLKFQITDVVISDHEKFIQNDITPKTSYINSICLNKNGYKEITLFGVTKE